MKKSSGTLVCPWPECIFRSLLQFLVNHDFTIYCPGILNFIVSHTEASLSGQTGTVLCEVFINVNVLQRLVILTFSFDGVFLARKTRSLILRVANLTSIWRGFPVAALPARCETALSCAWTGGSTLMAAQSVRTAASVSSDASFSGIPAILRLQKDISSWMVTAFGKCKCDCSVPECCLIWLNLDSIDLYFLIFNFWDFEVC